MTDEDLMSMAREVADRIVGWIWRNHCGISAHLDRHECQQGCQTFVVEELRRGISVDDSPPKSPAVLPPFLGVAACPKCTSQGRRSAQWRDTSFGGVMERTCHCCGYTWCERCADAAG